jgi:hypothetical protein
MAFQHKVFRRSSPRIGETSEGVDGRNGDMLRRFLLAPLRAPFWLSVCYRADGWPGGVGSKGP